MKDIHSRVGLLLTFVPAVIVLYFINDLLGIDRQPDAA